MSTENVTLCSVGCGNQSPMDIAERIVMARKLAGFDSASDAAKRLGLEPPAYRHYERGTRMPPNDKLAQMSRIFHVDLSWLITGKGEPSNSGHAYVEAATIPLLGSVQAGAWTEQAMIEPSEAEQLPIPVTDLIPGARQYYLQIIGDSVNQHLPDGSRALCCDVWDWARDAEDLFRRGNGKLVVAQRERSGLYETTIKRLVVENGRPALYTASDSPKFRNDAPIDLNAEGVFDGVTIVAVVTSGQIPL